MTTPATTARTLSAEAIPAFCEGIQYFNAPWADAGRYATPVIGANQKAVAAASDPASIYQTLLGADALRYLTLQVTGAKASGHPGGFASSADVISSRDRMEDPP